MKFIKRHCWLLLFLLNPAFLFAQTSAAPPYAFSVIPLGVRGGLDESNLSSYLVTDSGKNVSICLDAGTLYSGIHKAVETGSLKGSVTDILKDRIKAYFITHAHLDHVAGLIINSPEDTGPKNIYALPSCLATLRDKYFTWESWANFGNSGEEPRLNKYHYMPMPPSSVVTVEVAGLTVRSFVLSHGAHFESAAFLVQSGDDGAETDKYLLYLGDTGADTIEHSTNLHFIWQWIAPLIKARKLKAIFIETSFPDEQPEKSLFGHLTPKLLMQELDDLADLVQATSPYPVSIVITHRKPSGNQEAMIMEELEKRNHLRWPLIFPEQGVELRF